MGQNSSTFHSFHSSGYPSPELSALPSGPHSSPSSGDETANAASEPYLSTASNKHNQLSALGSNYPLPSSQPIYTVQSSSSAHHAGSMAFRRSEGSTDGKCSITQQSPQMPQEETLTVPPAYSQSQGMFGGSHNLSFRDNTFIEYSTTSDDFMEKFLQHTIIGAEYDSSDRYPPPRCHPGTRLAIVERCKFFIIECHGKEKVRWVVGPAGVGKSAIMQIVAEETPASASVFFSVNGRRDGTKTFTTIAYQLATKYETYRQFIRNEISRNPSLFRKSLPVHFRKFIVEPFISRRLFNPSQRFLIIIDGLDECGDPVTQVELLKLISEFCITYPTSPIVWFVASRPEPHITSFFDEDEVAPAYTKEDIIVDSDEACEDVQRYLRDELSKIKRTYSTLKQKREWPSEFDFTKVATAAGGLFAYASTVIRYIGDPHYRDPAARLRHVLETIDTSPNANVPTRDHPMAQLDALYARILSNIPADIMVNTRKLLLIYSKTGSEQGKFRFQCNRLGLTEDDAYGALSHLYAVVKVPAPHKADDEPLEYFHKSFPDFLFDFKRSKFCYSAIEESKQLKVQSLSRILEQVPDDLDGLVSGQGVGRDIYGLVKGGPGFCQSISLSWPGDERFLIPDSQLKLDLYCHSMYTACIHFTPYDEGLCNMFIFRLMTTRFIEPGTGFPFYELRYSAFSKFRSQLTELGELKRFPLRRLDYAAICGKINLRFTSSMGLDSERPDRWNPSCKHKKHVMADVQGLHPSRGWSTSFQRFRDSSGDYTAHKHFPRFNLRAGKESHWESVDRGGLQGCLSCSKRLVDLFVNNPDQLATVFVDSTEMCYVELSLTDPEDDVLQWEYQFFHSEPPSCVD